MARAAERRASTARLLELELPDAELLVLLPLLLLLVLPAGARRLADAAWAAALAGLISVRFDPAAVAAAVEVDGVGLTDGDGCPLALNVALPPEPARAAARGLSIPGPRGVRAGLVISDVLLRDALAWPLLRAAPHRGEGAGGAAALPADLKFWTEETPTDDGEPSPDLGETAARYRSRAVGMSGSAGRSGENTRRCCVPENMLVRVSYYSLPHQVSKASSGIYLTSMQQHVMCWNF